MDIMDIAIAKALAGEGGSGGSGTLIVNIVNDTLDKTWNEIKRAAEKGVVLGIFDESDETEFNYWYAFVDRITEAKVEAGQEPSFMVYFGGMAYETTSADGYPVLQ